MPYQFDASYHNAYTERQWQHFARWLSYLGCQWFRRVDLRYLRNDMVQDRLMFSGIKFDACLPMTGYDILVVSGQSNATNAGEGSYGAYAGDPEQDGRIFQIGRYGEDNFKVIRLSEPVHFWDQEGSALHSFAVPLARLYASSLDDPARRVLVIPAAKGSTSILQWLDRADWAPLPIYSDMADRLNFALTLPGDARIIGLFDSQGEADIGVLNFAATIPGFTNPALTLMPTPEAYGDLKIDLIDRFRGDFGEVPMLFGYPPDAWLPGNTVKAAVKAAIADAAAARSHCAAVDTTGFPSNSGLSIHYSAEGLGRLAAAYMTAFLST